MWNTNLVPNYIIAWHFKKPHVWSPITVNQLVLKIFLRGTIASWTYYISLEKPFRVIGNFHPLWNDPKVSLETFPNLTYSKDKEVHLVNFPSVDKENEPDNNNERCFNGNISFLGKLCPQEPYISNNQLCRIPSGYLSCKLKLNNFNFFKQILLFVTWSNLSCKHGFAWKENVWILRCQ